MKADGEETLTTVYTAFEEHELIRCTYTDEALYSRVSKPLSRVLNVALAKGGPETVVQTLYTVQRHGQPAQGRRSVKRPHKSGLVGLLSRRRPRADRVRRAAPGDVAAPAYHLWRMATSVRRWCRTVITRVSRERGRVPILKEIGRPTKYGVRTQRPAAVWTQRRLPSLLSFVLGTCVPLATPGRLFSAHNEWPWSVYNIKSA